MTHTEDRLELKAELPAGSPVYYRLDHGKLTWSGSLDCFSAGRRATPSPGQLLAIVHGIAPAPDATTVPAVHKLAVGDVIRVDQAGVTVTEHRPELPATGGDVLGAVAAALDELGEGYGIAYSGGVSSAFVAIAALKAKHRPVLLHADLGPAFTRLPVPEVPGLSVRKVRMDLAELLARPPLTGTEPPVPDLEVNRRMIARLAAESGTTVVAGALLEDLLSSRLADVDRDKGGHRLLQCEPFHIAGTLPDKAAAEELLALGSVHEPEDTDVSGTPPSPMPVGSSRLPGLTVPAEEQYQLVLQGNLALWQARLESLDPVLGRAATGLAERGDGGAMLPALDVRVLAAANAVPKSSLGEIRHGMFRTHVPLRKALDRSGVRNPRRVSPGYWLRLAAAGYLHANRAKLITRLDRDSPLADLGLIDARRVAEVLGDGLELTEHALRLLRLTWVDHWLRGSA
ncbi:hypothetical protein [Amycolatopsis alba]|uniref:hypothetical protein n=1 Tax=Amycolatopsis alba TaxID=76020 RepID=UPI0012F9F712|nr:hypothetical protein [Amycolatopsis alba]